MRQIRCAIRWHCVLHYYVPYIYVWHYHTGSAHSLRVRPRVGSYFCRAGPCSGAAGSHSLVAVVSLHPALPCWPAFEKKSIVVCSLKVLLFGPSVEAPGPLRLHSTCGVGAIWAKWNVPSLWYTKGGRYDSNTTCFFLITAAAPCGQQVNSPQKRDLLLVLRQLQLAKYTVSRQGSPDSQARGSV